MRSPTTRRERSLSGGIAPQVREGYSISLKSEDVPPEQFALVVDLQRSFFGFHSLANFCASAIWACVIFEAAISLNISAHSRFSFSDAGYREVARLNRICART